MLDDATIISAACDHSVRIWDLATGNPLHLLTEHSGDVIGLAITPDGHHLISASRDYALRLWDIKMGELQQTVSIDKRIYHQRYEPG
jgi:WD40 repeat protein